MRTHWSLMQILRFAQNDGEFAQNDEAKIRHPEAFRPKDLYRHGVAATAILFFLSASQALACASCGSGGDDPMILYPWESWKAYVSIARTGEIESLDNQGDTVASYGPKVRNTTTVAMGHSFSPRLFATATAPYIVNRRDEYDRSSWGDPLLALRYTALQQTMANDLMPQIQLVASYRTGQATSKYDQTDSQQLDVFGSGIPEGRAGFDIWSGMYDWKGGFAQTMTVPIGTKDTIMGKTQAGYIFRSTLTLGYGWLDNFKLLVGLNRDQTTRSRVDGVVVDDSDILAHGTFLTADAKVERNSTVRLTWNRSASIFANRNATRSQTFTMAVMRSF
jgi:hypothetical protein